MIEIFNNALAWVLENSDNIRLVLSIVTVIFMIITTVITIKHKNLVTKVQNNVTELSKVVTDYKKIIEEFDNLHEMLSKYELNTVLSVDKMTDVQDVDTDLIKKLNAVLDVLGLAFSTSKNDAIRIGITNVINEARRIDPNNAKLVKREIERMAHNAVKTETATIPVESTPVEPVKEIVKPVVDNTIRRL